MCKGAFRGSLTMCLLPSRGPIPQAARSSVSRMSVLGFTRCLPGSLNCRVNLSSTFLTSCKTPSETGLAGVWVLFCSQMSPVAPLWWLPRVTEEFHCRISWKHYRHIELLWVLERFSFFKAKPGTVWFIHLINNFWAPTMCQTLFWIVQLNKL